LLDRLFKEKKSDLYATQHVDLTCLNPHSNVVHASTNRAESRANGHKMTKIEGDIIKERVSPLDQRGAAPTQVYVRKIANALLAR